MKCNGILLCLIIIHSTLSNTYADVTYKWEGRTYKLIYHAEPWREARELCEINGAKLAVPKSEEEFLFLQHIVRKMHYPSVIGTRYKLLVWLGISNLDDFKTWKDVDGQSFNTSFHVWADDYDSEVSDLPDEPHCGGMDAVNYGIRKFWCHHPQPYICYTEILT
ncbi:hypothetical protein ACJJTC_006344 [Scirpophaga incertulas]